MTRHKPHDGLPRAGCVTRLDVVVDQACVASRGVKTLPQILKENPNKHRANRQPHDCEPDSRGRFVLHTTCVIQCWIGIHRTAPFPASLSVENCSNRIALRPGWPKS